MYVMDTRVDYLNNSNIKLAKNKQFCLNYKQFKKQISYEKHTRITNRQTK